MHDTLHHDLCVFSKQSLTEWLTFWQHFIKIFNFCSKFLSKCVQICILSGKLGKICLILIIWNPFVWSSHWMTLSSGEKSVTERPLLWSCYQSIIVTFKNNCAHHKSGIVFCWQNYIKWRFKLSKRTNLLHLNKTESLCRVWIRLKQLHINFLLENCDKTISQWVILKKLMKKER